MKILKLGLLAILMALVVMSCSDDSTNPDDGGGDGTTLPNSKVTIKTTVEGQEVHSKTLELKDGKYIPSNYSVGGSYNNTTKMFSVSFTEIASAGPSYGYQLSSLMEKLEAGTYSYTKNDAKILVGAYTNKELGEQPYMANTATLVITKVQFIGNDQAGAYYTSGTLEMDCTNEENVTPNVSVIATFESVPLSTVFLNY
ncbi:MAG: hypothetical protein WC121_05855 [Candidatus Kapaibacterium sp.]